MHLLALALACVTPPQAPDCSTVGAITGDATATLLDDGSLNVRGTALHPDALAMRGVWVGEQPATPDGFNYSAWSASLSARELLALSDGTTAVLEITTSDVCVDRGLLTTLTVDLPRDPPHLDRLSVELALPGGRTYLPADGSASAAVDLRANPEAAGLIAHVSSAGGSAEATEGTLALGDDGDAHWVTTWSADTAGPAVLAATVGAELRSAAILVVGPPLFLAYTAEIGPGAAMQLQVDPGQGSFGACSASGELGVSSGGRDLKQTDGGADLDGDGLLDLSVTAALDSSPGQQALIACWDAYGQTAHATVTRR